MLVDGWLYSGDAGYIDEASGHLVVIDRLRNLCHLADGTSFSPQFVEDKIKFIPVVQEAVVFGDGRSFLVALINIDARLVSLWAENNQIAFTTYRDLAAHPKVYELVARHLDKLNSRLPESFRVQRFVLLPKELDADDGELTRTNKVRRSAVSEKYRSVIEDLYGVENKTARLSIEISYRSGRVQRLEEDLKIREMLCP